MATLAASAALLAVLEISSFPDFLQDQKISGIKAIPIADVFFIYFIPASRSFQIL
jgi:hypothetical protein